LTSTHHKNEYKKNKNPIFHKNLKKNAIVSAHNGIVIQKNNLGAFLP